MIAASIGRSAAGKRIRAQGLAYERGIRDAATLAQADQDYARYLVALRVYAEAKANAPDPVPEPVTIRRIIADTAGKHGLTYNDILTFSRAPRLIDARFEAMYESAVQTRHSLIAIGHAFGGRDHTTVINAIRRHSERHGLPMPRGLTPRPVKVAP